jgi:hypothetical protein
MAADLRGDLLGAEAHVTAADVRWLTPLPLWAGILAGPVAWALDLGVSYAIVKWTCRAGTHGPFAALTAAALAMTAAGAAISWTALERTRGDMPEDGGTPRQRARFMAMLGLTSSALFALTIAAAAIPWWVLDACR